MPAETPKGLKVQLLAALSAPEGKFLEGHFINANTALNYGEATPSLNRLITKLTECDGMEVTVTSTKGDPAGGRSWTVGHNGCAGARSIGIQINIVANALNLDQLSITVVGTAKPSEAAKPR
jgi:hypothetical protein